MLLGTRNFATDDVRVEVINYDDWLYCGYVLTGVTASITPTTAQSTVNTPTLNPTRKVAFVTITCAPVNESFTLNLVATDTLGQVIHDTLNINVVAPGAT